MKLWHVHRDEVDWDEYDAFVIRAETADAAYAIAESLQAGAIWNVDEVMVDGEPGVIMESFLRG